MRRQQKTRFLFQDVFSDADCFCKREEDSFQYFQCLLSDKEAESFEKHLGICSVCGCRLVELQEAIEVGESTAIHRRKADEIFQENLLKLLKVLEVDCGN